MLNRSGLFISSLVENSGRSALVSVLYFWISDVLSSELEVPAVWSFAGSSEAERLANFGPHPAATRGGAWASRATAGGHAPPCAAARDRKFWDFFLGFFRVFPRIFLGVSSVKSLLGLAV